MQLGPGLINFPANFNNISYDQTNCSAYIRPTFNMQAISEWQMVLKYDTDEKERKEKISPKMSPS